MERLRKREGGREEGRKMGREEGRKGRRKRGNDMQSSGPRKRAPERELERELAIPQTRILEFHGLDSVGFLSSVGYDPLE